MGQDEFSIFFMHKKGVTDLPQHLQLLLSGIGYKLGERGYEALDGMYIVNVSPSRTMYRGPLSVDEFGRTTLLYIRDNLPYRAVVDSVKQLTEIPIND